MERISVAAVVGPTAAGKSRLAVELALRFGGEIISADSMQIYRGMEIGTAQPDAEERRGIAHHLIGIRSPDQPFSVADYVELASQCIAEIHARGKLPVVAGGTGLYAGSLLEGIHFSPAGKNERLRSELRRQAETEEGRQALFAELQKLDPESAERIHPNNVTRLVRALEIYRTTGITMTEQIRRSKETVPPYNACIIGLSYRDRAKLYGAIDRRVDAMVRKGLPEEARRILEKKNAPTALQAIGYKEFAPYFAGECGLSESTESIKRASRHYAKRQLTWFRRMRGVRWIFVDDFPDFASVCAQAARILSEGGRTDEQPQT